MRCASLAIYQTLCTAHSNRCWLHTEHTIHLNRNESLLGRRLRLLGRRLRLLGRRLRLLGGF